MAVSLPIPVLAPVIMTVFPSSLALLLHATPFTKKTCPANGKKMGRGHFCSSLQAHLYTRVDTEGIVAHNQRRLSGFLPSSCYTHDLNQTIAKPF